MVIYYKLYLNCSIDRKKKLCFPIKQARKARKTRTPPGTLGLKKFGLGIALGQIFFGKYTFKKYAFRKYTFGEKNFAKNTISKNTLSEYTRLENILSKIHFQKIHF